MSRQFFCKHAKAIKEIFNNTDIENYKIFVANQYASFYVDFGSKAEDSAKKRISLEKAMLIMTNQAEESVMPINFISIELVPELTEKEQPVAFDVYLGQELIRAAAMAEVELVIPLIESGINVNIHDSKTGQTALHAALRHLFKLFGNFDKNPADQKTILQRMQRLNQIIHALINNNCDLQQQDYAQRSPLAAAIDMLPCHEKPYAPHSDTAIKAAKMLETALGLLYEKGVAVNIGEIKSKGYEFNINIFDAHAKASRDCNHHNNKIR